MITEIENLSNSLDDAKNLISRALTVVLIKYLNLYVHHQHVQ